MTVTTSYAVAAEGSASSFAPFSGLQSAAGTVTLDNGNIAAFYINETGAQLRSTIINAQTGAIGATNIFAGSVDIPKDAYGNAFATSVAKLDNGNIIVTWAQTDGTVYYRIFDQALAPVSAAVPVESSTRVSNHPDVASLPGGGFVITWEETFGTTDHDIYYKVYDAAQVGGSVLSVSESFAFDEHPSVTRTPTGFAIGYDQKITTTGDTVAWVESFDNAGTSLGPELPFDNIGTTNRYIQMSEHAVGWIATYEDSQYGTTPGATFISSFVAGGTPAYVTNGTPTATIAPGALSRDGFLLVPVTENVSLGDYDVFLDILLPNGNRTHDPSFIISTFVGTDEIAGQFAWTDASHFRAIYQTSTPTGTDPDASLVSRLFSFTRTLTGDGASDTIDVFGQYVNNVISGGGGIDVISGGFGHDVIDAGDGDDFVSVFGIPISVDGGTGSNRLTVNLETGASAVSINLGNVWGGGTGSIGSGTVTRFQTINYIAGTNFGDTINVGLAAPASELSGRDGDDVLVGGNAADWLLGQNGRDILIGNGGDDILQDGTSFAFEATSGNELYGGTGNDVYKIVTRNTSIIEVVGEGDADRVETGLVTYVLPANVEQLTFTGTPSSRLGIGNAGNNIITGLASRDELFGGDGNDRLIDGGGGAGLEDTMLGGLGDDTYVVSVRGNSTIELVGQGIDTVETSFSIYALQSNLEKLTFTDSAAHAAGVGNALNNIITGNTGADSLFGREGNDTLTGGSGAANTLLGQEGDDLYNIWSVGDSVIEFIDQGSDIVIASGSVTSFTLPANVEILGFSNALDSTGIGNGLDNRLQGSEGNDFLSGLGGADSISGEGGNDTLLGGAGNDRFNFLAGFTGGLDRILDFTSGQDKFEFDDFNPTLTIALVSNGAPAPNSTNTTILYNVNTSIVSLDVDGTGPTAAIQIAQLNAGQTVTLGDFLFI